MASTRVIVAIGSIDASDGVHPAFVDLPPPFPSSDPTTPYILSKSAIHECNVFQQRFASWFINNTIASDGSLYIATPIDPLFILLPALEKASASGGMFCDMETILQQFLPCDDARMLYQIQHMVPSDQLACICDTKESGGQLYVRLNSDKVVTWLLAKLRKTREALCSVNSAFSSMDQHSLNAYALGIVSEYVSEAWSSALSDKCLPPSPAVNDDPNAGYATHLHDDLQHYNGEPNNHNNSSKKARMMDAKEVAKAKAEASRAATKAAKLEKASAGMRKLSSFFSKK